MMLAKNIEFVSHSDLAARGDGVQVMVHRGFAYIGHLRGAGVTILDVRDPREPKPAGFLAAPPGTWSLHLQTQDDLLLVVNGLDRMNLPDAFKTGNDAHKPLLDRLAESGYAFSAGLRIFNLSDPAAPREIGFLPVDGLGLHRAWYTGGRYAYVSAQLRGFTDFVLLIVDVSDPTRPSEAGRYWLSGMWEAGGEKPTWNQRRRVSLHHAIVAGGTAYAAWRDGGMTLIDVGEAAHPRLIAHRNWSPPFGGGTHTTLPLPDRRLVIVADEAVSEDGADGVKHIWVVDVREPSNPVTIATFPLPSEDDFAARPGTFGPHNLHEMRPGSLIRSDVIFATLQNAGVRAYDISNPFAPREIAYFVPPPSERPGALPRPPAVSSTDVYADVNGMLYVTDTYGGLFILQWNGR